MSWKSTGHPTVRQQRDHWVVRLDGIDTETGKRRPRQLGTYKSRRSAQAAANGFAQSGEHGTNRDTVAVLVDSWVASRVEVSGKTRMRYEWAAGYIRSGLGALRLDQLERDDVAKWLDQLATGGQLARRSITIMRMVLRAALADGVESGQLRRSPAARVGMPRNVARPSRHREADARTEDELHAFLDTIRGHRWEGAPRLDALYGLRRSELLGLQWATVDLDKRIVRIVRGLVEVHGRPEYSEGKNARSRRAIPIDAGTAAALYTHRRFQAEERLAAGALWDDQGLVVASRHGNRVSPGNFDQTLDRLVNAAGVPPHLARAAPRGRYAHGPPCERHRRDPRDCRPPRSQPGHADAHLRPRDAGVGAHRHRQDRRPRHPRTISVDQGRRVDHGRASTSGLAM